MVGSLNSNEFRQLTDSSKRRLPSVIKNFEGDDAGSLIIGTGQQV